MVVSRKPMCNLSPKLCKQIRYVLIRADTFCHWFCILGYVPVRSRKVPTRSFLHFDTFCSRSDTFSHACSHNLLNADTFWYVLFNSLADMLKSYFGHKFRTDCWPSPSEGPSCQDSAFVTLRYVPVRSGIRSGTFQSGNPFYTRMVFPRLYYPDLYHKCRMDDL